MSILHNQNKTILDLVEDKIFDGSRRSSFDYSCKDPYEIIQALCEVIEELRVKDIEGVV